MRTVAGADQDDVGDVPHQREHGAVARSGQPAGLAVVGGSAVQAGDHVAAHPARLQVVGIGVEVGQPALVGRSSTAPSTVSRHPSSRHRA